MQPIFHRGRLAALVGPRGIHLAPRLLGRPVGDPELATVLFMAAYALGVRAGHLPGPYDDGIAARLARAALVAGRGTGPRAWGRRPPGRRA